jgi:SNF2 family DNA or RNA helicase
MLKTIKYHGQNRHSPSQDFTEADIIITTYHTLASDFTGNKKPLRDMEWYRLVLDEGV